MLSSAARTTAVTAGQGGGKTTGGYWWLLSNLQAFPGESHLVGFPDYGLLQRVILNQPDPARQTLPAFLRDMGEHPKLKILERRVECKSGQIFFTSGEDLPGWEGAHVKTAWLDEFDLMPLEAYHRAMERTRMRRGFVLLTGTPRLIRWVHLELKPLWERNDPSVLRIQFPSIANPAFPAEALEEARRTLPAWEFARLYLGELAAEEGGGVFKREWWKYYNETPSCQEIIQSWDTAFKISTSADYSVCSTWGVSGQNLYLLDIWRKQIEYPELLKTAQMLYSKYKPSRVLIEDTASGQSLIQDLRRNSLLPIIAIRVDKDKYSRASAVTGLVESGRCYLPLKALWLHDYVEELAAFPNGDWYDDQVDSSVMALAWLKNHTMGRIGLYV